MKICSVTMAARDTRPQDAYGPLLGAGLVDSWIMDWPGEVRDFAFARNKLLARALDEGFDWAVMIDTDERLSESHVGEFRRLHDDLTNPEIAVTYPDVWMARHVSGTYEKERIFRLPPRGKYVGPTHEAFILNPGARRETLSGVVFDELPKTPEQLRDKLLRDETILEGWARQHPDDPRWWYYLGDTYANIDKPDRAKDAFTTCFSLDGWDEESAWAMYRAAELCCRDQDYQSALACCTQGLQRRADFPELHWLAGWCCYQLGRYEQAIVWSRLAMRAGEARGGLSPRIGFRHPPAHYEAPYDVIRWAWRALGEDGRSVLTEAVFEQKLEERKKAGGYAPPAFP